MLKIAPCWPLTGSVYTAMFKAVRVLLIFNLKGGMSGSASRGIRTLLIDHGDQFTVSSSVGKRNAQEGTKTHGMRLHSCDIAVTRFED